MDAKYDPESSSVDHSPRFYVRMHLETELGASPQEAKKAVERFEEKGWLAESTPEEDAVDEGQTDQPGESENTNSPTRDVAENSSEYSKPELDLRDRVHLQRLYNMHGMDRVLGWLRANVAVPLRHQFQDDFDEDEYYQSLADHYVEQEDKEEE